MNRVVLINKTHVPTRSQLTTTEREVGERILSAFNVRYAGYMIVPNRGVKAAMWVVEDQASMDGLREMRDLGGHDNYEMLLYTNGLSHLGGQREVLVA